MRQCARNRLQSSRNPHIVGTYTCTLGTNIIHLPVPPICQCRPIRLTFQALRYDVIILDPSRERTNILIAILSRADFTIAFDAPPFWFIFMAEMRDINCDRNNLYWSVKQDLVVPAVLLRPRVGSV